MEPRFSDQALQEFENILLRYPRKQAAILPVLRLAEQEFGYISPQVEEYLADLMGLEKIKFQEAMSYYTLFHSQPVGKYLVRVCSNISCTIMGAETVTEHLKWRLGVEVGETTLDGHFTLEEVECLAACDGAPVMMINDELYQDLTSEKVDEILGSLE